jgi:phosphoglycolate phosphatase
MTLPPQRPDAVIFDWDNTLVDSWRTIHGALVETFTAMDQEPWTLAETKQRVRQSLRDSFPNLFGARWEEAASVFYAAFERSHIENLAPMPGAKRLLQQAAALIPLLGVVSNKTGRLLRKETAHLGWDDYFAAVIGAGDASRDKPDAAPVDLFRTNNGLTGESVIWYVGDADIDIETAANSGCIAVLVHPEHRNQREIVPISPEIAVAGCEELAAMLETL